MKIKIIFLNLIDVILSNLSIFSKIDKKKHNKKISS